MSRDVLCSEWTVQGGGPAVCDRSALVDAAALPNCPEPFGVWRAGQTIAGPNLKSRAACTRSRQRQREPPGPTGSDARGVIDLCGGSRGGEDTAAQEVEVRAAVHLALVALRGSRSFESSGESLDAAVQE